MLKKLLGINWKTTLPGILAILAVAGKIALAYRTKNIEAILSNGQDLVINIGIVLAGIGLITAKASDVTGAGAQSKAVDSAGTVTNVEGEVVGKQATTPAK